MSRRPRRRKASRHPPRPADGGREDRRRAPYAPTGRSPPGTPEGDAWGCLLLSLVALIGPALFTTIAWAAKGLGAAIAVLVVFAAVLVAAVIALFRLCTTGSL